MKTIEILSPMSDCVNEKKKKGKYRFSLLCQIAFSNFPTSSMQPFPFSPSELRQSLSSLSKSKEALSLYWVRQNSLNLKLFFLKKKKKMQ
jgi:hypothetical protein